VLREAEGLREELELWRNLESRARSTAELLELAQEENDQSVLTDVDTEASNWPRNTGGPVASFSSAANTISATPC